MNINWIVFFIGLKLVHRFPNIGEHFSWKWLGLLFDQFFDLGYFVVWAVLLSSNWLLEIFDFFFSQEWFVDFFPEILKNIFVCFFDYVLVESQNNLVELSDFILYQLHLFFEFWNGWDCSLIQISQIIVNSKLIEILPNFFGFRRIHFLHDILYIFRYRFLLTFSH